jgi:hypothetical protein
MIAEELPDKPEEYFAVTEADSVLLEAISNLGKAVHFNSLDETQIDELTYQHGTSNLEYQNNYYRVGIPIVEPASIYSQILWVSIVGFAISTTTLIAIVTLTGASHFRKQRQHQTDV